MPSRDVLDGVDRLYVDGSNLLPALAGSHDAPPVALLGRIRGALPPELRVEIVFDGPADRSPIGRVASGTTVRYSGRRSADAMLIDLASTAGLATTPPGSNVLVVTDDRGLAHGLRKYGVRTVGTSWLVHRLERRAAAGGAGSTPGHARAPRAGTPPGTPSAASGGPSASGPTTRGSTPPAPPGTPDPRDADAAANARRWQPGRGATRKTGNARPSAKPTRTARSLESRPWKRRRSSGG